VSPSSPGQRYREAHLPALDDIMPGIDDFLSNLDDDMMEVESTDLEAKSASSMEEDDAMSASQMDEDVPSTVGDARPAPPIPSATSSSKLPHRLRPPTQILPSRLDCGWTMSRTRFGVTKTSVPSSRAPPCSVGHFYQNLVRTKAQLQLIFQMRTNWSRF
jgi:hypothetical protein